MIRMTLVPSRLTLILITLLGLGSSHTDARGQAKACGSEIRPIEVNQTTLHYFECGKEEPLMFVHGSLGDLHTFREQVEAFATNFRVIAYSRRFAPPNAPPRDTDVNPLSIHVADLRTLIDPTESNSGASRGQLLWRVRRACVCSGPCRTRAQPDSRRTAHPPSSLEYGRGRSHAAVVCQTVHEPARKALESGNREEGLRRFVDAVTGPGSFDNFPQSVRTELVEKQAPELRSELMTEMSALMQPLNCGDLARLKRPTLLVTGERTPAMFLLITSELERCLEGESHVMVPEASHSPHRENAAFYTQAVLAFLQRR